MIIVHELGRALINGVNQPDCWQVTEVPSWIGRLLGRPSRVSIVKLFAVDGINRNRSQIAFRIDTDMVTLRFALMPDRLLLPEDHPFCAAIRSQRRAQTALPSALANLVKP